MSPARVLKLLYAETEARIKGGPVPEGSSAGGDLSDMAVAAEQRETHMSDRHRLRLRLKEIVAALGRIDDGTYGVCVGCDEQIKEKRLAVIPEAARCVRCAEDEERLRRRQSPVEVDDVDEI